MVLRRFRFEKIDKPSQIQALDGMRKKRPTFLLNSLDMMHYIFKRVENAFIWKENIANPLKH